MWLLAGLGNPGAQYAGNRHNIGFMALDALAASCRAPPWRSRFQALVSEAALGTERVILMKPATYMNESGRAIGEAARFYKIEPAHVIVLHDELDLPPAVLRVKLGGGNAGHNGLRSATAVIGNDYVRVRLGIGHPGDKALVHNYVLSDFAKAEQPWVADVCDAVAANAALLTGADHAGFQARVTAAILARGHGAKEAGPRDNADAKRGGETDKKG